MRPAWSSLLADPTVNPDIARQLNAAGVKVRDVSIGRGASRASRWVERIPEMILAAGLPAPEAEFVFHPRRRWRFDWAWPDRKVALEYEGGVYGRGRHVRPIGFQRDCEKYNEAAILGWTVLRVTVADVKSGTVVGLLDRVLGRKE